MFDHTSLTNPTAHQNAATAALSQAASQSALSVTAKSGDNDAADGELARQRAIVDQIDLSIEANQRIEQTLGQLQRPVFEVQTNALDVVNAIKPAMDEAQTRMNREAFIVLAMMGIPPAKARAMANAMTGGAPEDMAVSGANGSGWAISAQELSLNISNGASQINLGVLSASSQRVEIDISAFEAKFSRIGGQANVSISEFKAHIEMVRIEIAQIFQQDPLILDLDGNGIDITSLKDGQLFDIDGDGTIDQTAWIKGADALLALDRNGDGEINDGRELFGDQHGAKDGFAELSKFDDNLDGLIDQQDGVFSSLVLLRTDGSQQGLADAGIKSISLAMVTPIDKRLIGGDLVAQSQFERDDGSTGQVGEVFFDVKA
ncbi:hypothetical protein [uncultured Thalassospira sp.]|uniref:hypothetical protein n=1 Tax=uncultured Thalassospira sp. TaxID=404382 RepID=UPI002595A1B6|nr:hypothetical protein [uncultured Thalassospira sp.]|tara:strand:- start:60 stop:1184 length:1125 start_codon:yes stop_codon:yes gene_type:complete